MSGTSPYSREYTDLLSERVGGKALACSDEWFAECANLVKHDEPVFKEGHFVSTGQWMDGWESRRSYGRADRSTSGRDYDWCVLRLGIPGVIHGVDVETTHFRGNAPEFAALEGAWVNGDVDEGTTWFELLPKNSTTAHDHNIFDIDNANFVITSDIIKYRHKVTPYEGRTVKGIIDKTLLRGMQVYADGDIVGSPAGQAILRAANGGSPTCGPTT